MEKQQVEGCNVKKSGFFLNRGELVFIDILSPSRCPLNATATRGISKRYSRKRQHRLTTSSERTCQLNSTRCKTAPPVVLSTVSLRRPYHFRPSSQPHIQRRLRQVLNQVMLICGLSEFARVGIFPQSRQLWYSGRERRDSGIAGKLN